MSFTRKKKRKSAAKRSTFISYVNFPISDGMAASNVTPAGPTYENLSGKSNGAVLSAESELPPPNTYVNLPSKSESPQRNRGSISKLSPQHSDPCISTTPYSDVIQVEGGEFTVTSSHPHRVDDTKLRLLVPDVECVRCKELGQLLAMWELGVSGLARNYSKILSHLNKAKEAALVLECRVKQKAEINSSMSTSKNLGNNSRGFRQSVYGGTSTEPNLAQQMYPQEQEQPTPHEKQFSDLNTHLGEAIDVCQQLAAACFKSNQSSSTGYSRLRRQPTMPNMPVTSRSTPTTSPNHQATLQSISEEKPASSGKKHRFRPPLERTPSAPLSDITSSTSSTVSQERWTTPEKSHRTKGDTERDENGLTLSLDNEECDGETEKKKINGEDTLTLKQVESFVAVETTTQKSHDSPSKSHDSPSKSHDSPSRTQDSPMKVPPDSPVKVSNRESAAVQSTDHSSSNVTDSGTEPMMEIGSRDSILSTYSESDVKQVMSKLADLEEVRLKLLETKEKMYHENQVVRQSLSEILGDLASKDLQLTLAMQDLHIATKEITKAAEMREKLAGLEAERDVLLERLGNLEDESAAVKLSLIRLLQEKSATNKTLALENWRLNQRMRHMANATLRRGSKSETPKGATATGGAEEDDISVTSGFSTNTEDATLQEAYMDFDVSGNFVHKQGFLVKQGAKVKSWKKRLFVLNTDGLSYYKTEQPIQVIPIRDIEQVQVCHRIRCPYPNMFQVHTSHRVFFLSASSEDEMQSWVGMLQTLKQYNRVATLHREAVMKAQLQEEHHRGSGEDEVDHHQPLLQSQYPAQKEPTHDQDTWRTASLSDDDALLENSEPVVKSVPVTRSGFTDMDERIDIIASLDLELS